VFDQSLRSWFCIDQRPKHMPASTTNKLRRDLGTLESYAVLIGILIGAGIFQVTSQAWAMTGPSVILGYAILTPAILATSIPYAAYLSTPLGREPGGEYLHISRTLKGYRLAYVGSWLKIISYIGAGAYLANALAGYLIALIGDNFKRFQLPIALGCLVLFYVIHVIGVLWFGRMQVIMCALKLLALLVLILPGLFMLKPSNYTPFITHGWAGFGASLLPLFFAYAGFESLAQTAGEVKDSTKRLPRILLIGISITALIYVLTSVVSFGVLPGSRLQSSSAPMAEVASIYLPQGATVFVILGAIAGNHDSTEWNYAGSFAPGNDVRQGWTGAEVDRLCERTDCNSHSRTHSHTCRLRTSSCQWATFFGPQRCGCGPGLFVLHS
jgi:amino acid transporter